MSDLLAEIFAGVLYSKPVQFILIWITVIMGGWFIQQLGYSFLKSYIEVFSILNGVNVLLDALPIIFLLLGLGTALGTVGLIES